MGHIAKYTLIMSLMASSLAMAQSTTNSIYIDQVGDSSTINLTQTGQANKIGTENERFQLQGNNQTVNVTQAGSSNSIQGSIVDADNINLDLTNTGDSNTVNFDLGSAGSVAGSSTTLAVTGSSNTVNLTQGNVASSTGAAQNITILGDQNNYTSVVNADDTVNTTSITGSGNNVNVLQNGNPNKNINMTLTGNTNNFTVNQTSTLNVDALSITSQSNGSTVVINQCNAGAC
jgi:hypothetical protein